jgi:hypothetical protein
MQLNPPYSPFSKGGNQAANSGSNFTGDIAATQWQSGFLEFGITTQASHAYD